MKKRFWLRVGGQLVQAGTPEAETLLRRAAADKRSKRWAERHGEEYGKTLKRRAESGALPLGDAADEFERREEHFAEKRRREL